MFVVGSEESKKEQQKCLKMTTVSVQALQKLSKSREGKLS